MILFNEKLDNITYLTLDKTINACKAPCIDIIWENGVYITYFGLLFIAIGVVLYTLMKPSWIKNSEMAHNLIEYNGDIDSSTSEGVFLNELNFGSHKNELSANQKLQRFQQLINYERPAKLFVIWGFLLTGITFIAINSTNFTFLILRKFTDNLTQ